MISYGALTGIQGKTLKIALDDDLELNKINRLANGKQAVIELRIADSRTISPEQRKKIYALINDLCDYTGDLPEYWKERFKFEAQGIFEIPKFSLSDCSMTIANYMILTILDFLFEQDIPFNTKTWDSLPTDFPKQMLCLKNKRCVLCGKKADIAHYQTVGSGRNRRAISHVGMYIMTLCREHHTEQHTIGILDFCEKYHIKPIKVTEEIAKQLKLGRTNKNDE